MINKKQLTVKWLSYITAFTLLLFALCFISCKENDIDPSGYMEIKVVNASPGSGPQSFKLVNETLVNGGLDFTDATSYIRTHSGTRLDAEFIRDGSDEVSADGELWTADGLHFTIYLVGKGSNMKVKQFEDELSSPDDGKAKVKYIHLTDDAPSTIYIEDTSGGKIVSSLTRYEESGYKMIDPGTLTVNVFNLSLKEKIGSFTVSDLQAGRIYSLYLVGSTDGSLSLQKVVHN